MSPFADHSAVPVSDPTPVIDALQFPHPRAPAPGDPVAIGPGVAWLRLPLPYRLDHINVWLLEDADGTTLVDTGIGLEATRCLWLPLLAQLALRRPLRRIIVTHHHPDHIGLARWLRARTGAPVWMTRPEQAMAGYFLSGEARKRIPESLAFYHRYGCRDDETIAWFEGAEGLGAIIDGMPEVDHYIGPGEEIVIGPNAWRAIVTPGHAPGHLVLHCAALRLLITGDQLLPAITSNVGLRPYAPDADPLDEYLRSVRELGRMDTGELNLPSHGLPFVGIAARAHALGLHHGRTIEQVRGACTEPRTAPELQSVLFPRVMDRLNSMLALTETLAHLRLLERRGVLAVETGPDRVIRFRSR
jgi:glyoxylase-like metal-dependent hydrolase (beta-lactamase superfamily II)